jgi:hypothetical protein
MPAGSLEYRQRALAVSLQTVLDAPLPLRGPPLEPPEDHSWTCYPLCEPPVVPVATREIRSFGRWLEPRYIIGAKSLDQ